MKLEDPPPIGIGILAVIAVFLAVWGFLHGRHPKDWRQWWMALLGKHDMNTTREQRRKEEFFFSIGGYVGMSFFLGLSIVCSYWVYAEIQEQRQARSDYDKARNKTIMDFEKMKSNKQFRKL